MTVATPNLPSLSTLSIEGAFGYVVHSNRVTLTLDSIVSHRTIDNLSGTLAVELRGYRPDATHVTLASTTIGQLNGQHCLMNCVYDLMFQPPAAGDWELALELREWDGTQYALMDRKTFDQAYCIAPTSIAKPSKEANNQEPNSHTEVIELDPEHSDTAEPEPKKSKKDKIKKAKKSKQCESEVISINNSSVEVLKSVKGMPKQLAEEIVNKRPHKTWDALLSIKGMGPKLLKKLRKALELN